MSEIFILDVETEGLKKKARILECAYLYIGPQSLAVSAVGRVLVVHDSELDLELRAREMHEESGLLEDLRKATACVAGLAQRDLKNDPEIVLGHEGLSRYLVTTFQALDIQPASVYLTGMSVQYDRGKLTTFCPDVVPYLSHRNLDLSTIRELTRFWAPLGCPQLPKTEPVHRSMADCTQALETLRWIRDELFVRNRPQVQDLLPFVDKLSLGELEALSMAIAARISR